MRANNSVGASWPWRCSKGLALRWLSGRSRFTTDVLEALLLLLLLLLSIGPSDNFVVGISSSPGESCSSTNALATTTNFNPQKKRTTLSAPRGGTNNKSERTNEQLYFRVSIYPRRRTIQFIVGWPARLLSMACIASCCCISFILIAS